MYGAWRDNFNTSGLTQKLPWLKLFVINQFFSAPLRFLPDKEIWQFELIRPHNGTWSRISVKTDRLFNVNSQRWLWSGIFRDGNQWNLPKYASADSEGITRIIGQEFVVGSSRSIVLRYVKWSLTILEMKPFFKINLGTKNGASTIKVYHIGNYSNLKSPIRKGYVGWGLMSTKAVATVVSFCTDFNRRHDTVDFKRLSIKNELIRLIMLLFWHLTWQNLIKKEIRLILIFRAYFTKHSLPISLSFWHGFRS